MFINNLNRGLYIAKEQGVLAALQKGIKFFWAKSIANIGSMMYEVNSQEYWDFRMQYDWNFVGGGEQTMYFAAGLFANVDYSKIKNVETVLDYGCATGDSSIILKIFLPKAKISLFDISKVGVSKAILKYSRFIPVEKYSQDKKYDLVYSSNVIEHVDNPKAFVQNIIELSNKYIIIQCPWKELHYLNNQLITPQNQTSEHKWTIDEDFFNKYIDNEKVTWVKTIGVVPMAWQGGEQVFFFGEKIHE